ncbi:thiamine biosynthesis protein ThiS [Polynucleobacter aenigmaticus]|jgi:sulfur carrier protein|uniref:Thiamine biosynthesis protein ThiS n=1 Tax=Polynucleobacter aenigmaticus TaxID=1743164 RepID=A0A254PYA8_9BURK|nr:sulfur carrier protein ThiS [Polynucleobacter aenigmaticus]OWS71525.1 thiamine biosynthesis protein ThiS [Polynucleobacter aenigmaticus]
MRVIVNQIEMQVPENSSIDDVLLLINAKPPFAVAINYEFVPKTRHAEEVLHEGDEMEVIEPVTGG